MLFRSNQLRVPEEIELKGLDIPKHGEPAYPLDSYGDGWSAETLSAQPLPYIHKSTSHLNIAPVNGHNQISPNGKGVANQGVVVVENPAVVPENNTTAF